MTRRPWALAGAVLFSITAVAAGPAVAQNDFQAADFVVEVAGQKSDSEVFQSRQGGAILLLGGELELPVLLKLRAGEVETVNLMSVDRQDDGSVRLLAEATVKQQGKFQVAQGGTGVSFSVDGKPVVLKEKPPLLGDQDLAGMRAYSRGYVRIAETYSPSAPVLKQLRGEARTVRVEVFFGSWCPFCQQMVPRMMRVAEELAGSAVQVDFYGLPRDIDTDSRARAADIHSVPTGIVYVDGREAGRISGNAWKIPELAVSSILRPKS